MAKPRRAVRRRVSGRVLVSSALIGVTAVATFAVWQMSDTEASVALPAAEESAVIDDTTGPSTSGPSATESASAESPEPSATAAPSASAAAAGADWAAVVADCQQRVKSRDTVIARAATGIDHWSQHVQAQTDANAGRISVAGMKKSFMRTRLLGPSDVASYRGALDLAAARSGSCATPADAPAKVAATLAGCSARIAAQKPVLVAGSRGMHDWDSHLAAMRRNKMHHVDNAQQIWIAAWRAAPDHIKDFDKAAATYRSAAAC